MKTPEEVARTGQTPRDRRYKLPPPSGKQYEILDAMTCPEWVPMAPRIAWRKLIKCLRDSPESVAVIKPQDSEIILQLAIQLAIYRSHVEAFFDKDNHDKKWNAREITKCTTIIESLLSKLLLTPSSRKKVNMAAEQDDAALAILSEFGVNK